METTTPLKPLFCHAERNEASRRNDRRSMIETLRVAFGSAQGDNTRYSMGELIYVTFLGAVCKLSPS